MQTSTRILTSFLFLVGSAFGQAMFFGSNVSTASAPISPIDHKSASAAAGGTATTVGLNCIGANSLFAAVANYNLDSTTTTPEDDGSVGGWSHLANYVSTDVSLANLAFWYKPNATVTSNQVFSVTGSFVAITAACFSVVKTSSPQDQDTGSNDVDATVAMPTGSITPTINGDLLLAAVASNNTGSASIDNSFTVLDTTVFLAPGYGLTMAWKVQTTAAAINPEFTLGAATGNGATAISSFKAQ